MVNPSTILSLLLAAACLTPIAHAQPKKTPIEQSDEQPPAMSAELAARRIEQILSAENPGSYEADSLADIAARCEDPGLAAVAAYNAGVLVLEDSPAIAAERFRDADLGAGDANLRAAARYNLAHATLAQAPELDNPPTLPVIDERIAALTETARLFRSVLEVDANHHDAAANTERLRKEIKALQTLRKLVHDKQEEMQQLADQLQDLAQQQQQQAQQSQQQAQQGESPSEQDRAEQQQTSEQTQQAQQQAAESGAPQDAAEAMQRAREAQQRAEQALEDGDAETAAQEQQNAAEALREAAERAQEAAEQGRGDGDGQGDQQAQGEQPQPQQQPAEEQSEQPQDPGVNPFAEALIENEREQHARRMRYLQQTGRQRVERDW